MKAQALELKSIFDLIASDDRRLGAAGKTILIVDLNVACIYQFYLNRRWKWSSVLDMPFAMR
jgi:hypothetical protein